MFWYRAATAGVTQSGADGLPLAVVEPLDIGAAAAVEFGVGDIGVFPTDGFVEAQNHAGECFGPARFAGVVRANAGASAAGLIEALERAVAEKAGS